MWSIGLTGRRISHAIPVHTAGVSQARKRIGRVQEHWRRDSRPGHCTQSVQAGLGTGSGASGSAAERRTVSRSGWRFAHHHPGCRGRVDRHRSRGAATVRTGGIRRHRPIRIRRSSARAGWELLSVRCKSSTPRIRVHGAFVPHSRRATAISAVLTQCDCSAPNRGPENRRPSSQLPPPRSWRARRVARCRSMNNVRPPRLCSTFAGSAYQRKPESGPPPPLAETLLDLNVQPGHACGYEVKAGQAHPNRRREGSRVHRFSGVQLAGSRSGTGARNRSDHDSNSDGLVVPWSGLVLEVLLHRSRAVARTRPGHLWTPRFVRPRLYRALLRRYGLPRAFELFGQHQHRG